MNQLPINARLICRSLEASAVGERSDAQVGNLLVIFECLPFEQQVSFLRRVLDDPPWQRRESVLQRLTQQAARSRSSAS